MKETLDDLTPLAIAYIGRIKELLEDKFCNEQ